MDDKSTNCRCGAVESLDPGAVQNTEWRVGDGVEIRQIDVAGDEFIGRCKFGTWTRNRQQIIPLEGNKSRDRNQVRGARCDTRARIGVRRKQSVRNIRYQRRRGRSATDTRRWRCRLAARLRTAAVRIKIAARAETDRSVRTGRRCEQKHRADDRDSALRAAKLHTSSLQWEF